jgi:hypothetical protein
VSTRRSCSLFWALGARCFGRWASAASSLALQIREREAAKRAEADSSVRASKDRLRATPRDAIGFMSPRLQAGHGGAGHGVVNGPYGGSGGVNGPNGGSGGDPYGGGGPYGGGDPAVGARGGGPHVSQASLSDEGAAKRERRAKETAHASEVPRGHKATREDTLSRLSAGRDNGAHALLTSGGQPSPPRRMHIFRPFVHLEGCTSFRPFVHLEGCTSFVHSSTSKDAHLFVHTST